ncbi:unnamed protein product [Urochloa decumbens]|uniref:PB1 domain-containing protein n=1 Tax=Urochloa decumbens TaxID=240449 RepID=A0ABC8XYM5_9POAL
MAASEASSSRVAAGDGPADTMKLVCSHGGRLLPRGPDGAIRYAGGETRVLAVPRDASFRDLARRLQEMAGGAEVRAVRHRLADEALEDVLVSVTCDEELAHMRAEYDRLRATRPAARFRLYVTTAAATAPAGSGGAAIHRGRPAAAAGLPPLAPRIRRVQSEQAQLHRRPAYYPAPVRRVQSAHEFAGRVHVQQPFHHQQCRCCCPRRDMCAPARPMQAMLHTSKKVAAAPMTPAAAKATGRVVSADASREQAMKIDAQEIAENRRTIWELE